MDRALLPMTSPPAGGTRSKNFALWPFQRSNHNVVVMQALKLSTGLADNVWSGTVLASYLYEIMGQSNSYAGYIEAAQGISSLVVSVPVGLMADRGSKARVIAAGGVLLPVAVAATSFAVVYGVGHESERWVSFFTFMGALMLWGAVQAIQNGPGQALFADSTPKGERSKYMQKIFSLNMCASVLGPALSLLLFVLHGDTWDLTSLRNVFLVGMGLEVFAGVAMLLFRDDCALTEEAAAAGAAPVAAAAATATATATATTATVADATADATAADAARARRAWLVPRILFASNLMFGVASGMTIKFFPLFFKNECGMSPVGVQAVYTGVPLLLAACARLATFLAARFGRVQTMVLLKVIGVGLLVAMALLVPWVRQAVAPDSAADDGGQRDEGEGESEGEEGAKSDGGGGGGAPAATRVGVIVAIYLLRTGLMNCTFPLSSSIMMDSVPADQRARWASAQSLVRFGWCGSAAAGGVLADRFGYAYTFLITAGVQAVATVMQCALLPLVPRAEKPADAPTAAAAAAAAAAASASAAADDDDDYEGDGSAPRVSVTPLCAPTLAASSSPTGSIQEPRRRVG